MYGPVATSATGAKSFSASYGMLRYSHGEMTCGVPVKRMLYPSGGDFATESAPMVPPAPGLFSTNTCLPSALDRRGASIRAGVSAKPPGESGTTRRIGRDGQDCATTWVVAARKPRNRRARIIRGIQARAE